MVFFSFTAPRTTQDDMHEERMQLSEEQKNLDELDLYGIASFEESEEKTEECLEQLRKLLALEAQAAEPNTPIQQAYRNCANYILSAEFLIMFLRAERFEVDLALKRICIYWEFKISIFGDDSFHPLSARDLSEEDIESLRLGGCIILPNKDEAGRTLLAIDRSKWLSNPSPSHRKSFTRAYWYTIHQALMDVETQKRGIIGIVGASQDFILSNYDRKITNLILDSTHNALPMRVVAIHVMIPSKVFELVLPFILWATGKRARRKVNRHFTPLADTILCLASEFGIAGNCIPIELGGTLNFNYQHWINETMMAQREL